MEKREKTKIGFALMLHADQVSTASQKNFKPRIVALHSTEGPRRQSSTTIM